MRIIIIASSIYIIGGLILLGCVGGVYSTIKWTYEIKWYDKILVVLLWPLVVINTWERK